MQLVPVDIDETYGIGNGGVWTLEPVWCPADAAEPVKCPRSCMIGDYVLVNGAIDRQVKFVCQYTSANLERPRADGKVFQPCYYGDKEGALLAGCVPMTIKQETPCRE